MVSHLELRWRRRVGGPDSPNQTLSQRDVSDAEWRAIRSREGIEAFLKTSTARTVDWLDFVIDGESLWDKTYEALGAGCRERGTAGDLIGCLGPPWTHEYYLEIVPELLARRPSSLKTGRVMLYVCPECGDIGCGAITAVVEESNGEIIWRDFGHEVDYQLNGDDPLWRPDGLEHIGPFHFDADQYYDAITNRPDRDDSAVN